MNVVARLSAFAGVLVLLGALAYGVGSLTGPFGGASAPAAGVPAAGSDGHGHGGAASDGASASDGEAHAHASGASDSGANDLPGGLAASAAGYTFVPADRELRPGEPTQFAFRILGPRGAPVTRYVIVHDKPLHLIVVRRDGTGFQHLHPELDATGTWRVPLTVPTGGSYRAFADFSAVGGPPLTLGVDLDAPGEYLPAVAAPVRTARVGDYTVELAGDLVAGRESPLTLTVRRGDVPVTDLQPYLTAYGHLVALREGDLAYLHVHPVGVPGDGRTAAGPDIRFDAEVPSEGRYRLYLDFQHDGVVRTAEFVVDTTGKAAAG